MTDKCRCWRPWDHQLDCVEYRPFFPEPAYRFEPMGTRANPAPCGEPDEFGAVCPLPWLHTEPHQWLVRTQNP